MNRPVHRHAYGIYARQYPQLTESAAAALGDKAVELEAKRQAATAACYMRVRSTGSCCC